MGKSRSRSRPASAVPHWRNPPGTLLGKNPFPGFCGSMRNFELNTLIRGICNVKFKLQCYPSGTLLYDSRKTAKRQKRRISSLSLCQDTQPGCKACVCACVLLVCWPSAIVCGPYILVQAQSQWKVFPQKSAFDRHHSAGCRKGSLWEVTSVKRVRFITSQLDRSVELKCDNGQQLVVKKYFFNGWISPI